MGCGSSTDASDQQKTHNRPEAKVAKTEPKVAKTEPKVAKTEPKTERANRTRTETKDADSRDNAVSGQFVQEALKSHNKYRAMHGAPAMKVAHDLVDYAQNYANKLAQLDTMKHSNCTLPSGERVGENLYCYWSSDPTAAPTAEDAVQSWYDEIKDYNFNKHGFSMGTGHFTQVVWKKSVELGMAWAKAAGGTTYVVANYRPAGNMMGDFEGNVAPKK